MNNEMSEGPIRKSEILSWVVKYTVVTVFAFAFILHVFVTPEFELMAESSEPDISGQIEAQITFATFSVMFLVVFWATYRRIRHEKVQRHFTETEE